jgi:hypothetical protein
MKRLAIALVLAACGGMGPAPAGYTGRAVPNAWAGPGHAAGDIPTWTIGGGTVYCDNADWQASLTPVGVVDGIMVCDWRCVTFNGRPGMDVRVSFKRLSADGWAVFDQAPTIAQPPCGD